MPKTTGTDLVAIALEWINILSNQIGPRPSGSEAEKSAMQRIEFYTSGWRVYIHLAAIHFSGDPCLLSLPRACRLHLFIGNDPAWKMANPSDWLPFYSGCASRDQFLVGRSTQARGPFSKFDCCYLRIKTWRFGLSAGGAC